jgi:hypothetical protein
LKIFMADNNKIVEVGGDLLAGKTNLKTVSLSGNGLTHVDNLFGDVSIYLKVINFEILNKTFLKIHFRKPQASRMSISKITGSTLLMLSSFKLSLASRISKFRTMTFQKTSSPLSRVLLTQI